jgi:hypothetical protein
MGGGSLRIVVFNDEGQEKDSIQGRRIRNPFEPGEWLSDVMPWQQSCQERNLRGGLREEFYTFDMFRQ